MSKAYKCDHCGTLYDDESQRIESSVFIVKSTCRPYDLCPDCQKKLEAFVHYKEEQR